MEKRPYKCRSVRSGCYNLSRANTRRHKPYPYENEESALGTRTRSAKRNGQTGLLPRRSQCSRVSGRTHIVRWAGVRVLDSRGTTVSQGHDGIWPGIDGERRLVDGQTE